MISVEVCGTAMAGRNAQNSSRAAHWGGEKAWGGKGLL